MANLMRINKYLPFAILYFFLNSVFLTFGLTYTTLLTPFLLIWLYRQNKIEYWWVFFILTIPFVYIHYRQGIDLFYYSRSYVILFTVFVFILTMIRFLQITTSLRTIFRLLLTINFFLVGIACILFFIPGLRNLTWSVYDISTGITKFPRLSMFTYEPSYYSTLLIPLAFYYYLKIIFFKYPNAGYIFFMVSFPLIISFSLGVILGLTISFGILFFPDIRKFLLKKNVAVYVFGAALFIGVASLILYHVYPDNPLYLRIRNIFSGKDTSFQGRGSDSFHLAWTVAREKSIYFGIGLGQLKLIGEKIWNEFYNTVFSVNQVRIPNAVAETFAIYGICGLIIRFSLEWYFFFRTKTYSNYYRLGLFIFIFIYQFTGSYFSNLAEFTIWTLAFSHVFEEFDRKNILKKSRT